MHADDMMQSTWSFKVFCYRERTIQSNQVLTINPKTRYICPINLGFKYMQVWKNRKTMPMNAITA